MKRNQKYCFKENIYFQFKRPPKVIERKIRVPKARPGPRRNRSLLLKNEQTNCLRFRQIWTSKKANYFQAETRCNRANDFWGSWKDLEQRGPGNTRFWLEVKNVHSRFGKEETRKLQLLPRLRRKQVKI